MAGFGRAKDMACPGTFISKQDDRHVDGLEDTVVLEMGQIAQAMNHLQCYYPTCLSDLIM